MKKTCILCLVLLLVIITAASCTSFTGLKRNYAGTNTNSQIAGTYELLDGTQTKTINLKTGKVIEFKYKSMVETGSLAMALEDPDKVTVVTFPANTSGEAFYGADKSGNYHLVIKGDNTKGSFDIKWVIK